jgi:hypothetical protein
VGTVSSQPSPNRGSIGGDSSRRVEYRGAALDCLRGSPMLYRLNR